jgi:hypothetical protein
MKNVTKTDLLRLSGRVMNATAAAADGHVAVFDGSGKALKDSGIGAAALWYAGNLQPKRTILYTGVAALASVGSAVYSEPADHHFFELYLTANTNSAHHTSVWVHKSGIQYHFVNEYHVQKALTCRNYGTYMAIFSYTGVWVLSAIIGYKIL